MLRKLKVRAVEGVVRDREGNKEDSNFWKRSVRGLCAEYERSVAESPPLTSIFPK